MKPVDYRNNTWEHIKARLSGLRMEVYTAFVQHGPATTRELATKSGISILTLRPRTTELIQLGFVEILGGDDSGREAVYIAIPEAIARDRFEWLQRQPVQVDLPF